MVLARSVFDEVEDDGAEVVGGPDSPGVENRTGHRAVALKREVSYADKEFDAGYVTPLVQPRPCMPEGVVHEHIGVGLVPGILGDDSSERVLHVRIVAGAAGDSRERLTGRPGSGQLP